MWFKSSGALLMLLNHIGKHIEILLFEAITHPAIFFIFQ